MTQEELQKALEAIGKSGITVNGDLVLSKQVENEIGNVEAGGIGIQNVYNQKEPKAAKPKKKTVARNVCAKPKTLKYFAHGNNGRLMKQRQRVDIVFRLWNKWGWIDDQTTPDDFDAFFEGEPRHCNINWKASSTIPIFTGRRFGARLYAFEVLFPFLWLLILMAFRIEPWWLLIAFVALPVAWKNARTMLAYEQGGKESYAALDEKTAQLQLMFSLLLIVALVLSRVV